MKEVLLKFLDHEVSGFVLIGFAATLVLLGIGGCSYLDFKGRAAVDAVSAEHQTK